jgi:[ribosomal protein S5]-alanine N-acetyltransferase
MPNRSASETVLRTNRLVLEPLSIVHAEPLFCALSDESIYAFLPSAPPGSLAEYRSRIIKLSSRASPDGSEIWLNWALKFMASNTYVGTWQATVKSEGAADIAYLLNPQFWKLGLAYEAGKSILQFLRDEFAVRKVAAYIDTRNAASVRLVERLGLSCHSVIRDADEFKGVVSDEFFYSTSL